MTLGEVAVPVPVWVEVSQTFVQEETRTVDTSQTRSSIQSGCGSSVLYRSPFVLDASSPLTFTLLSSSSSSEGRRYLMVPVRRGRQAVSSHVVFFFQWTEFTDRTLARCPHCRKV